MTAVTTHGAAAGLLAEHRLCWRTATLAVCTCDRWARPDSTKGSLKAPVRAEHDAHLIDILFASGAVIDVATLADDEEFVDLLDDKGWPDSGAERRWIVRAVKDFAAALTEWGETR